MTCNCKAELAAIFRELAEPHAIGTVPGHISAGFEKMCGIVAARLSPPPSAPVPELAGWRAKCIVSYEQNSLVRSEDSKYGLLPSGVWVPVAKCRDGVSIFKDRAAAVAALSAASPPPGCGEDKPKPETTDEPCPTCTDRNAQWGPGAIDHPESRMAGGRPWSECSDCNGTGYVLKNPREAWSFVEETPSPTTGTTNTRPAVVADGKAASGQPVPAEEFDLGDLLRRLWSIGPYTSRGALNAGLGELYKYAEHVAAHAAGAASAKPRRWPEGRPHGEPGANVLKWSDGVWLCEMDKYMQPGRWWLPQPAAPAAAKEGT